jgi:sodium-dependent dicarboxylate transporter 2/3/5
MPDWQLSTSFLNEAMKKLGPLTRGEKVTGIVFLAAMALWILPDIIPLFLPGGRQHPWSAWATRHLDWSVTALLMMTVLFVIPVDWKQRKFAMSWEEAVKGAPWGTLSLVAAALTLGGAVANKEWGLGRLLDRTIAAIVAASGSEILLVLAVVAFVVVVGGLISNLVILAMVGVLAQAIGTSAGINPIALVIVGAMGANMDFALPIGTPGNALVFASGYVRIGRMVKGGAVLALLSIPIVTLLGFYMAVWVLSWSAR